MKHITTAMLSAAGLMLGVTAAAADEARIAVRDGHLVNGEGMSVYLFEADEGAKGSTCTDACAGAWPPVTSDGAPKAGDGVDPALLDTIERQNGATQVTYGGWPLYTFVRDAAPGDIKGQDVDGFGAEWYLVTPNGESLHDDY